MKNLTALILALLLFAGCAAPAEELPAATPGVSTEPEPPVAATQHPDPTLPFGFGTLKEAYSPYHSPRFTVDCYGDTSLLKANYLLDSPNTEPGTIMFSFSADEPLALTSAHYVGGILADEPAVEGLGTIERIEDGEWTHFCTLSRTASESGALRPYSVVEGDFSESFVFRAYDEDEKRFVTYAPGSYRITLSFRRSIDDDDQNYTTSEGLYSIQILFFIPEAGEAQFDLTNVGFIDSFEEDRTFGIVPFIRRNEPGATIYLDHARTRLERQTDDGWVEAPPREGAASAVENLEAEDSSDRYAGETSNRRTTVYVDDRDAAHRIVYEYCENEDGSGGRDTLAIPLDFSLPEEPGELTLEMITEIGMREAPATSANESIHKAGLSDHPNFGGCFITEDYHLGVCIKNNDPELKAAILDCAGDPDAVQFVETNASYEDLRAQQETVNSILMGKDGSKHAALSETGIVISSHGIRSSTSAVVVDLFARSKAVFDEFIAEHGDEFGENVYFVVRYGIDLAEVAADPDMTAPPPPTEPVDTGISLAASNVTRTGATVTFCKDDGGSMGAYTTGAAWSMDVWNGERWTDVPMTQSVWLLIGYNLGEFDINWEREFGALPNGYYRICKSAHQQGDSRNYYAQFTITDSAPETPAGE